MRRLTVVLLMSDPKRIAQCMNVLYMFRRVVQDHVRLRVLIEKGGVDGIQLEDGAFIECVDYESALEKLIELTALRVSNTGVNGCAAASIES